MFRVRLLNKDLSFGVAPDQSLLQSAIDAGVDYPFGCSSGMCGTCKTRLVAGAVDMTDYSPLALSASERNAGLILACRSRPTSDCLIVYDDDPDAPSHPVRQHDGRVLGLERVTHDVMIVEIKLEGAAMAFSPGQFATLDFGEVPPRDYSMASLPGDPALRFHVRYMPGGVTSAFVHEKLAAGATVKVRGPFGTAYWRERHGGPTLAIAGGTGLAPVLSIVEAMLAGGSSETVRLYFGVRDERDLYLTSRLDSLAARHANFSWQAVLSAAGGPTARRTGYVGQAAAADAQSLSGWKIYIAGPPIMVDATRPALLEKGVGPSDIHTDPFFTAADTAAIAKSQ